MEKNKLTDQLKKHVEEVDEETFKQSSKIRIAFDFIMILLWMFLLGVNLIKNQLFWIFISALWAVYFGIRTWNNLFNED